MIHFISMTSTKMEYRDFTNCEIASIVSFAITFNCEEATRLFLERFGKEPPPVRALRDLKARFLETLTVMPRKPVGNHGNRKISTEKRKFLQRSDMTHLLFSRNIIIIKNMIPSYHHNRDTDRQTSIYYLLLRSSNLRSKYTRPQSTQLVAAK